MYNASGMTPQKGGICCDNKAPEQTLIHRGLSLPKGHSETNYQIQLRTIRCAITHYTTRLTSFPFTTITFLGSFPSRNF